MLSQPTSSDHNLAQWRLIKSPASSAAYNMALDEAFLSSTAQKKASPTLRLYSWQTPSLSLGYAQPSTDMDLAELTNRNWQFVRRPTGGKAILHTDEITYSIAAPLDDPMMEGSLLESYQRISRALQKALQLLGASTSAENTPMLTTDLSKKEPVCFQTPSNFEITWMGKKLIGSAQSRKLGGVLQHGSLPLSGDLSRITQVLAYPGENERNIAAQRTLVQAATLEMATGRIIPWGEAAEAIIQGFASEFGITIISGQPTQDEIENSKYLMETKYETDSWNLRI